MNGTAVVFGRGTTATPAQDPGRVGIGVAAAVFILAAVLLIIFAPALVGAVGVKPGDAAPDFTVRTLGGGEVSLRDDPARMREAVTTWGVPVEAALEGAFADAPGDVCRKALCLPADPPAAP